MLLEITRTDAIWQISLITVVVVILSQWSQKKFSLSPDSQMKMQTDIKDLQDRMKYAKGDMQQMEQLNAEMMLVMKDMSKKQMIPMLVRSVLFLGLWALLGWIYADFKTGLLPFKVLFGDGYAGLYITLSLSISLLIMLVKFVMKKLNPEKGEKKESIIDHAKVLKSNIIYAKEEPNDESEDYNSIGSNKKWKQQLKSNNYD